MTNNEQTTWTQIRVTQTVSRLREDGPSLKVGVSACVDAPTETIYSLGQIDTGAHGTAISPAIAQRLGLKSIGSAEIREAGREAVVGRLFRIRLFLPPAIDIEVDVATLPSLHPPHEVLIGRDILAGGRMLVDFTRGLTVLQFKRPPT